MKYFITKLGTIIDENNNRVDLIEGTENYNNYVKFLQAGGTLEETENLSVEDLLLLKEVPEEITALQFFSQLLLEGITETAIRETVDYLVSEEQLTPTQGEIAKIALRKATVFERSHSFISLIGLAFSKTETELDAIFINASKL